MTDMYQQSVRVPVPLSVRPHIIGRQGANIQAMSKRTGARIQMPKQDQVEGLDDDDDSATIDVLIEGDAVSAEMARREIEAIVNERTSSVSMRLKDIPAEYYPFLAGPHNASLNALQEGRDARVQIPHYHTWADQAPPQSLGNRQQFLSHHRLVCQFRSPATVKQLPRFELPLNARLRS